jgi:hypothetical protein
MTADEAKATSPGNENKILVAGDSVTESNIETEGMIVDVETHAPHAHKTGHNWVDLVVAISALFVSVVSLGIGILHGRTMERMAEANARLVAANSWPFVSYGAATVTTDGVARVDMRVFNSGVGPAKIESAELKWKGVAYRTTREFLEACCGLEPASDTPFDFSVFANYVIRPGEQAQFLQFSKAVDAAVFSALQQAVLSPDLELNVCYCSIFDECWQGDLTTLSLTPKLVDACTVPSVPFDEGFSKGKR